MIKFVANFFRRSFDLLLTSSSKFLVWRRKEETEFSLLDSSHSSRGMIPGTKRQLIGYAAIINEYLFSVDSYPPKWCLSTVCQLFSTLQEWRRETGTHSSLSFSKLLVSNSSKIGVKIQPNFRNGRHHRRGDQHCWKGTRFRIGRGSHWNHQGKSRSWSWSLIFDLISVDDEHIQRSQGNVHRRST